MLCLYKPIKHDIYKLHEMVEYLVCHVWCEADDIACESRLHKDFKPLYAKYDWLKKYVDEIYEQCEGLSPIEKQSIKDAFVITNSIEKLCNAQVKPISISALPNVVEKSIKPLLVKFYESLLGRSLVPGDKLDYYNKLIEENKIRYCPCCGYVPFESAASNYREAFDHYLPKSVYPFASVNFLNLVPLCYKCNSDRKSTKDPIGNGKKAFYPFSDTPDAHSVDIKVQLKKNGILDYENLGRPNVVIELAGDSEQCETWDRVFDIKERYKDLAIGFSKTLLREIGNRYYRSKRRGHGLSYTDILDDHIDDYENDRLSDIKFLKKAFLVEIKKCKDLVDVYN